MKTIVVLASACRCGGALTIYNQFISHLKDYVSNNTYHIFVDGSMPRPKIGNVIYHTDNNHTWKHRIAWDNWGLKKWLKCHQIIPDTIVSFQNTGVAYPCKQIIYYHQSLPFFSEKWNPFKKEELPLFLYKYVYPFFVKLSLRKDTQIIVQIPFVKRAFIKKYNVDANNVHVMFPDINVEIPVDNAEDITLKSKPYFIFPANGHRYKQHRTLIDAVAQLKHSNSPAIESLKIVFTLDKQFSHQIYDYVIEKGCDDNFNFIGHIEHKKLLRLIKNSSALLFPSTIETLGLPLLEAASMGKAILAADSDYAKEVLGDYTGVEYIVYNDSNKWAEKIAALQIKPQQFNPIKMKNSSWNILFNLITGGVD